VFEHLIEIFGRIMPICSYSEGWGFGILIDTVEEEERTA
jgi:hypothetical protein